MHVHVQRYENNNIQMNSGAKSIRERMKVFARRDKNPNIFQYI